MINDKPNNQGNDKEKSKMPKFNMYWAYGLIALALILVSKMDFGQGPHKISYSEFKEEILENGDIDNIVVIRNEGVAEVTIFENKLDNYKELFKENLTNSGPPASGPHFVFSIPSIDMFEEARMKAEEGLKQNIPIEYETRTDFFGDFLTFMWPLLLLVALWVFIFRRMGAQGGGGGAGNIFNVGKSRAKVFDKEADINVNFKDVAGLVEAKQELEEIVEFLKRPEKYTELGGKIPKGALLVGPPGTGKTLLAKAVAGEANVPFFSMSGSDFVEMFVGVGASRVRDLFKKAKEKSPCIVFIDEIDAIGRARGKSPNMGANDERENTLNQLLTEMDGFGTNSGVIILAATNRADILDRALMRAGRFDRQIHVELPDLKERKAIFEVHLRPLRLSDDVESKFLAKQTPGFSGADIANVCNEAALIAARNNKKIVEKEDFLSAVDRIVGGLEKKNKIISKDERKAVAYHEAGHATISWLLEHAHPLVKVTIVPRGKALGAAWYLPEERQLTTTEQILDEMCSTLGGRAAEEIMFGKISTGALNDLEKVTKQAYAIVTYYGMSEKIGHKSYFDSSGQSEYSFGKPYSEKTAEIIDEEVSRIIDEQYKRARKILTENHEKHSALAEKLLDKEVIFSEDLEKLFGKRKISAHVIEEDDDEVEEVKAEEVADNKAEASVDSEKDTSDKKQED
ncbi:ATP-dependent zinc metalloprotease FtsH [Carboxylicivirga sp. N1Y90]|uniref:ATP-dependent zinc metalloprotease FtsH n=1 Tax=Carboxylicivirga fragile TaxID=3417571 RepID=UPI003D328EBF|nr:ATP-dependent zinc metalloprotease FtsH [Marinilabiliaceae bacterium N1Y90]